MRKKYILALIVSCMMLLVACQNTPDSAPVPTPTTSLLPTNNPVCTEVPVPTNTTAPTIEPTEVPTIPPTETPVPTEELEPTPTEIPHEHVWNVEETPATCTEEGKTWEECVCGKKQNEQVVPKLTHGEKLVYSVRTEPTIDTEGFYIEFCFYCGEVVNSGSIPMIGAAPTPTPTPKPEQEHKHVWLEKTEPATCVISGMRWEECECGEKQNYRVIPKMGHLDTKKVTTKEPTVDTEGKFDVICNACNKVVESGTLPKLSPTPTPKPEHVHEYTKEEIIPASCVTECYVYKVCECGEKKLDFTLPKSGHVDESYVEVKAPTLTEEGIYHMVCDLCKEVTEKGTIPMLTPTPTPKPTATPTPAISTIPVVEVPSTDFSNKEVVEVEQIDEHITRTTYADGTKAKVYVGEDGNTTPLRIEYPDGSRLVTREDGSLCYYDNEGNRWSLQEHNLDNDHIFYTRFYLLADYTKYHVLCNSDGSLNQWSDIIFEQHIMAFSDITGKSLALYDINYSTTELHFSFRETGIEIIEGRFVSSQKVTPISWEEFYEVILK